MKIVFVSNYMTHHQLPFCLEMHKLCEGDFYFVADIPIEQERIAMGYPDMRSLYSFIIEANENEEQKVYAQKLIDEADVVIIGSAPLQYIQKRLKKNKLTFIYSERLYKQRYEAWKFPVRVIKHFWNYGRYKSLYLLCASAYTAADFAKTGLFINKAYKWGYFPKTTCYDDVEQLIACKEQNSIMWAGRFLEWKHPDYAIRLAKRLKEAGYNFKLRMVGVGDLDLDMRVTVIEQHLEDHVEFTGPLKPEEVREFMDKTQVYLFTSDRGEGWGAVLNESMNSGCAVVASSCAGATPYLVQHGENGLVYSENSEDQLFEQVCSLLDNHENAARMGKKAYETLTEMWNAELAAQRLTELCTALLRGETAPDLFESGPCSKAKIIKD